MELPEQLEQAVEKSSVPYSRAELRQTVERLSALYRSRQKDGSSFVVDDRDAIAYAAYRMPATFAAISSVFGRISEQHVNWQPTSFLDIGAGTGAGLWAATSQWDTIEEATLIDQSKSMIELGQSFAQASSHQIVSSARWILAAAEMNAEPVAASLVLASYVLNELPRRELATVVESLWQSTIDTLVVIEPGTPDGFRAVRQARCLLLDSGATILAPCPHDSACPMPDDDWCHFSVRLHRNRLHRDLKPGALPYEDEKFSYIVASRLAVKRPPERIVRHPQYRRGMVQLEICGPYGLARVTSTRGKDRDQYRIDRRSTWGDARWPAREDPE